MYCFLNTLVMFLIEKDDKNFSGGAGYFNVKKIFFNHSKMDLKIGNSKLLTITKLFNIDNIKGRRQIIRKLFVTEFK